MVTYCCSVSLHFLFFYICLLDSYRASDSSTLLLSSCSKLIFLILSLKLNILISFMSLWKNAVCRKLPYSV